MHVVNYRRLARRPSFVHSGPPFALGRNDIVTCAATGRAVCARLTRFAHEILAGLLMRGLDNSDLPWCCSCR